MSIVVQRNITTMKVFIEICNFQLQYPLGEWIGYLLIDPLTTQLHFLVPIFLCQIQERPVSVISEENEIYCLDGCIGIADQHLVIITSRHVSIKNFHKVSMNWQDKQRNPVSYR